MKNLSRFVTLLLVIALVFSMSAALAEDKNGSATGPNECTVKINAAVGDPFVTWTFPSEIIINYDSTNGTASLAGTYNIVVTDALIEETQQIIIGFYQDYVKNEVSVYFNNAPLTFATFSNLTGNCYIASAITIDDRFSGGNWKVPITMTNYGINTNFSSGSSHVIRSFEATTKLNFMVDLR